MVRAGSAAVCCAGQKRSGAAYPAQVFLGFGLSVELAVGAVSEGDCLLLLPRSGKELTREERSCIMLTSVLSSKRRLLIWERGIVLLSFFKKVSQKSVFKWPIKEQVNSKRKSDSQGGEKKKQDPLPCNFLPGLKSR